MAVKKSQRAESIAKLKPELQQAVEDVSATCKANSPHRGTLFERVCESSFLLYPNKFGGDVADSDVEISQIYQTWFATSIKQIMFENEAETFLKFIKENRLTAFAGPKLSTHRLPACNIWYETHFKPGSYPTVIPKSDAPNIATMRIARIAIHAIHGYCSHPFPSLIDPSPDTSKASQEADANLAAIINSERFLKDACLVAFIEDATSAIYTFAGVVHYGVKGGLLWQVRTISEVARASLGEFPTASVAGKGLTPMAQLALIFLSQWLPYYNDSYESLVDKMKGQTGENQDNLIVFESDFTATKV